MKGNKLLPLLLGLLLALLCSTTALAAGDAAILYTNDVHCAVDQTTDKTTGAVTGMGYAGVAAYKKDLEAQLGADNVYLVDAGDAIQGDAIGTLSKGDYLVDIMNEVGYDYAAYGNHEFDYGMARALNLPTIAKATYLSCNFTDLKTGRTVAAPYAVLTAGGHKIAIIGISTPETFTKSIPACFQDENGNYIYGFCEGQNQLYAAVQSAIDSARAEGAEIIIALGHLGTDPQSSPWRSTDVIAQTTGLDVFLDGHAHQTIPGELVKDKSGSNVLLTSTGTKLANLGVLTISSDGTVSSRLVSAADYQKQDAETAAYIGSIEAQYADKLNEVVASSEVPLAVNDPTSGKRLIRSQETNLGDLCADAYRVTTGADIAFVNGGGIRADLAAGDITYGDIIKVNPFGNTVCVVEASGQEIVDALEMASRQSPNESGGFLQVSGLMYTVDTTVPSPVVVDDKGSFVRVDGDRRVRDVCVLGDDGTYRPIDLDATYQLASHNYMLKSGGDGINMFMDNKILQSDVMIDNQALITYIRDTLGGKVGTEYQNLGGEGRILVYAFPFTDVSADDYYYEGVRELSISGLAEGVSASQFAPETDLDRGMLAELLWRMAGEPDCTQGGDAYFPDVGADAYYDKAVGWARESKIVSGCPDGTFRPDEPVTREQMAAMLYRFAVYEDTMDNGPLDASPNAALATDWADVSGYAQMPMAWAVDCGIFRGTEAGALTLSPQEAASRGQTAAALDRYLLAQK